LGHIFKIIFKCQFIFTALLLILIARLLPGSGWSYLLFIKSWEPTNIVFSCSLLQVPNCGNCKIIQFYWSEESISK